uniref:Uncharacterized protein n=1 Tax=Chenopodium quinoa TaxID=63459 RepID=A0A803KU08_CHEQI
MNDKRSRGLCFWCDEKYEVGHNCRGKRPRLYHIEVEGGEEELEEEQETLEEVINESASAQISLQALDGVSTFHTMRMKGLIGKKCLHILLDTGSTHNFIDTPTALKLSYKVEGVPPMSVKVADGGQLRCDKVVKDLECQMQGYKFKADFLLLPLSGSNVVLGVQWFATLGPILWDFKNLVMEFKNEGHKVKLRGATSKKLSGIQSLQLSKLTNHSDELTMLQVIPGIEQIRIQSVEMSGKTPPHPAMQALLARFADVFSPPKGLPPARAHFDHRIPLKEGTDVINQRPYRYPAGQKIVIVELV